MIPDPEPITAQRQRQVAAATACLSRVGSTGDIDEFIYEFDEASREFRQVEAAIKPLRLSLLSLLIREDIHVGIELIDRLLFRLVAEGSVDPVMDAVADLNRHSIHEPGVLLYPMHGYGVRRPIALGAPGIEDVVFDRLGVVVAPQPQSVTACRDLVTRAAQTLGVTATIDTLPLLQESANPRFRWLSDNPLMVVRVRSYADGAYDNQAAYMFKLGLGSALVMLLAVLVPPSRASGYNSSQSSGETLDASHYMVFENAGGGREVSYRRVPMNLSSTALAQLSDLSAELDPARLAAPAGAAVKDRAESAIVAFEAFHRTNVGPLVERTALTRHANKISDSIYWFRRSFTGRGMDHEAIVSLAVAFESLLIDSYAGGVTTRLSDRATHILKAEGEADDVIGIVRRLSSARGDVVHAGSTSVRIDLALARRAYAVCLLHVLERLAQVQTGTTTAIGDILGELRPVRPSLLQRLGGAWRGFKYG